MPKGPPPSYTRRDCRFDHVVCAVAAAGMGKPFTYRGIETPERAKDIKQGIYRCARHRDLSANVSWSYSGRETAASAEWPPDRQPDGTYQLVIQIFTKAMGRKRHILRYGTNRANWPYNPRQPKTQADIDAWAAQGLNEKGHRVT